MTSCGAGRGVGVGGARAPYVVSGAGGFVGSHVAVHLLRGGHPVIVVDRLSGAGRRERKQANLDAVLSAARESGTAVDVVDGDCADRTAMRDLFETGGGVAGVAHVAARAGVGPSFQDPEGFVASNVASQAVLLSLLAESAAAAGAPDAGTARRPFVYASSSGVYGGVPAAGDALSAAAAAAAAFVEGASEDGRPVSPYAATKRMQELLAHAYAATYPDVLQCVGLRLFSVYGPRGRREMAPYAFLDRVHRGDEVTLFGDPASSFRDWVHVDDVARAFCLALDAASAARTPGSPVLNVGTGRATSLQDLLDACQAAAGRRASVRRLPARLGDVPGTLASTELADALLGYRSRVALADGIASTYAWYLDDQEQRQP